ncbi:MAG TPA: ABC transporter substrate-binding protein, partial [bacterium]|nr:ABC transporter substrate-binding protein [bacterium]
MADARDRERREFEAGLAEEVDAWLRGDTSRRTFLTRLVGLMGLGAISGSIFAASHAVVAEAAVELASPDTPLGKAQAAAVNASTQ